MATGGKFAEGYTYDFVPRRGRASRETKDFFVWNKNPHLDFKPKKSILPKPWSVDDSQHFVESLRIYVDELKSDNRQLKTQAQSLKEVMQMSSTAAADEVHRLFTKLTDLEKEYDQALLQNEKLLKDLNSSSSLLLGLEGVLRKVERDNNIMQYGIAIINIGLQKYDTKLQDLKMVLLSLKDQYMLLCNHFKPWSDWFSDHVTIKSEEEQELENWMKTLAEEKKNWVQKANRVMWLLDDTQRENAVSSEACRNIECRRNEWMNKRLEGGSHLTAAEQKQHSLSAERNPQMRKDYNSGELLVPLTENRDGRAQNTQSGWYVKRKLAMRRSSA